MKKLIIATAVLFGLNTVAFAQEKASKGSKQAVNKDVTPEERAKNQAAKAATKLGLNEQQKADWEIASLKRILVNKPHRDALKGSTTPEQRKDIHSQIKANNEAFDVSVNAFLTEEQKAKYKTWKEEKREEMKKRAKKNKSADESEIGDDN